MMLGNRRSGIAIVATLFTMFCFGCQSKPPEKTSVIERAGRKAEGNAASPKTAGQTAASQAAKSQQAPAAQPVEPAEASPPVMPKVTLSDELRATCLVHVGDAMPEAQLPDSVGNVRDLRSLHGKRLTVICFWAVGASPRSKAVANAIPRDLMRGVIEPYGAKGVAVVGVNVGDSAEAVKQHVSDTVATFPNLLDANGEFYARVSKERKLPRTFLLDAEGRILWFDVEYSNAARRELIQAIKAVLGEK